MKNKELKPKLRFKDFTDDWEQNKLNELYECSQGQQIEIEKQFYEKTEDMVKFIRIIDLTQNNEPPRYIKLLGNKGLVTEDDLFMVRYGAIGVIGYGYNGVIANNLFKLINKKNENILNKFIYHELNSEKIKNEIIALNTSTTMPAISFEALNKIIISYPKDIEEQNKIAEFLFKIDNLINLNKHKLEKLINIKKSLLEKMFPRKEEKIPKIRFRGFNDTWKKYKLNNLSDIITKGTTPIDKSGNGNINFVKIENIDSSSGKIEITSKISEKEHNGYLKRSQLKENDLLFSIAGTLGRIAIVKSDILPANTNQALAIIRLKNNNMKYIKTYLKGKAISDFIKKNPTIGAQPNLSLEQVSNFDIFMPSEKEQKQIENFFEQIDELTILYQRKLEKLKTIKKSLVREIFA